MEWPPANPACAGSPGSLVAKRFVPFTVPGSPVSAGAAAKASLEGGTAAVHVRVAGVASTFPDASTARTENLWEPDARPVCACGDEQVAKAAPSSEHSNVPASLAVNENVAFPFGTDPAGPAVMVVSGGVVSTTVQLADAGVGSTLPTRSVARTEKECAPAARLAYAFGDVHAAYAAPSRRQAKVDPLSLDAKANETDWPDIPDGPDVIVVSGGVVSTLIVVGAETVVLCAASAARAVIATGPLAVPVFHVNVYGL